ncbi:TonB C-terminal domain-containing protein [Lysobacter enzymogenes]|uniref:TonB C-terminal domain-containing protein n=1 Tax=Lysobacter enzymogenes TaxID=69 RepID=A0A3N2RJ88_LYSEN|nr:TonB C-terminal domain-containing protein [Lysobacter enzymogenes]ROU07548.1 hypothetical protein D9T17_08420 [Lysobacter enzymogenes]
MRAAARSVARIAAVAAGLAAMPALATEIGRACDTPEHCLPQNQLRYYEVLRQAIGQHWQAPASAAADSACTLELTQSPGGKLVSVRTIQPCGLDPAGRDSLLAAARAASPLPYQGYQQVFRPVLRLSLHVAEPDDPKEREESRLKRWWQRMRDR